MAVSTDLLTKLPVPISGTPTCQCVAADSRVRDLDILLPGHHGQLEGHGGRNLKLAASDSDLRGRTRPPLVDATAAGGWQGSPGPPRPGPDELCCSRGLHGSPAQLGPAGKLAAKSSPAHAPLSKFVGEL